MPTPSKWSAARRRAILEILAVGGSRRTAAAAAGIDHATLLRWLDRGATSKGDTTWRRFAEDVAKAEASPRVRALSIVHEAMPDSPMLAWRFLERREEGYAPTPPAPPPPQGPLVIELSLNPGPVPPPVELPASSVIEVLPPHDPTDPEDAS
ncbi:MAG TPA: hypothetical protein VEO00_07090 [Actinomycetota bacterium]|nr:hypothetical protein [Actinomycetota bacterium]